MKDKMVATGKAGVQPVPAEQFGEPVVYIYRIDKDLPMPEIQTAGSLGFDLYSRVDMIIKPGEQALIPTNIILDYPEGYGAFLFPRSSLFKRKGLILANSVGVVDRDYNGPEDEVMVSVVNLKNKPAVVERGERIAQIVLMRTDAPHLVGVDEPKEVSRGGFGSTGA